MKNLNNNMSEDFYNEEFLNSIGKENPFTVPEGYFNDLTEMNLFHARLNNEQKKLDFTVPNDYFEESKEQILNEIRLKTLLEQEENEMEFEIPQGYFENLELKTLNQIKALENVDTPIRSIQKSKPVVFWKQWSKYAAAACIIIVGALFFRNIQLKENSVNFESLTNEEISEYLSVYGASGDLVYISDAIGNQSINLVDDVSELSNDEIRWYLENSL